MSTFIIENNELKNSFCNSSNFYNPKIDFVPIWNKEQCGNKPENKEILEQTQKKNLNLSTVKFKQDHKFKVYDHWNIWTNHSGAGLLHLPESYIIYAKYKSPVLPQGRKCPYGQTVVLYFKLT